MKLKTILFVFLSLFSVQTMLPAATDCETKNPVILAHGMGPGKLFGILDYWGSIPATLTGRGTEVYWTIVDATASTDSKAEQFKRQFLEIKAISGKQKFNIIAHSHGTVYTRLAVANKGLSPYVASHTSLAGPHKGIVLSDISFGLLPSYAASLFCGASDWFSTTFFGDKDSDAQKCYWELSEKYMRETFNPSCPDAAGVYYQSYAAKIKLISTDLCLEPSWTALFALRGENDGIVTVDSSKRGRFRGVQSGAWWCGGVGHFQLVGMVNGIPGTNIPTPGYSAPAFFVSVVSDLKNMGY